MRWACEAQWRHPGQKCMVTPPPLSFPAFALPPRPLKTTARAAAANPTPGGPCRPQRAAAPGQPRSVTTPQARHVRGSGVGPGRTEPSRNFRAPPSRQPVRGLGDAYRRLEARGARSTRARHFGRWGNGGESFKDPDLGKNVHLVKYIKIFTMRRRMDPTGGLARTCGSFRDFGKGGGGRLQVCRPPANNSSPACMYTRVARHGCYHPSDSTYPLSLDRRLRVGRSHGCCDQVARA